MKIFISWSGQLSNKVALVLRDWLPSVIQAIEPYVSSEDIDKGARWTSDIAKELEASRFGLLCITPENIEAPWLNFEAGALSKVIDKSRVCPFLFGLKRSEIRTGPFLQFQSAIYDRDEISKLLHSVNNSIEPRCIDESRLDSVFNVWWPELQQNLNPLLAMQDSSHRESTNSTDSKAAAGPSVILEELLDLARNQQKLLNSPEILLPPPYLESVLRRSPLLLEDMSPEAIDDLARTTQRLKELSAGLKEGEQIPAAVFRELVNELQRPIDYILRRFDRFREGGFRRIRRPIPEKP
jgi:hypothetical protein